MTIYRSEISASAPKQQPNNIRNNSLLRGTLEGVWCGKDCQLHLDYDGAGKA